MMQHYGGDLRIQGKAGKPVLEKTKTTDTSGISLQNKSSRKQKDGWLAMILGPVFLYTGFKFHEK